MSSKISPCCFWDKIPSQPSSISETILETIPNVLKDLTLLFLGRNPRPTFLYFKGSLEL